MANAPLAPNVYCQHQELLALSSYSRLVNLTGNGHTDALFAGAHPSRIRGSGLDFSELKNYQPGDNVRHMDWKKTHSSGRPHVRMYEEDKEQKVSLIVDQSASLFFASQGQMKSVLAAKLASLLAWPMLDRGDQLSFNVLSASKPHWGEFSRSKSNLVQALGNLAKANQALDKNQAVQPQGLLQGLQYLQTSVGLGQRVYIVSDFEPLEAELLKLLAEINIQSQIQLFLIYDPMERQLPEFEQLVVSDGQWQLSLNGRDNNLQRRYAQQFEQKREALQQLQAGLGVASLGLSSLGTDQDLIGRMRIQQGRGV